MKIRHVIIKNFRGIRQLEWDVRSDFVCLAGPGDATKSTVLDAIAYALAPGRFVGLNDADFYNASVSDPILIEITVTHPPQKLLTESKYALLQRGWSAEYGVADEPYPEYDPALTIQLQVDDALEPQWTVTKQTGTKGQAIGWQDRAALQLFRIDDNINTHLAWGRGSALAALTAGDDEIGSTLVAAHRRARGSTFESAHEKLNDAAATAYQHSVELGVPKGAPFRPGLDASAIMGATKLALHRDNVPLSNAGLGTRRLVALALQRAGIGQGSVVLIDEVEHGLEPHRLLHLLQSLRDTVARTGEGPGVGQVFLTTHSADAVAELNVDEVHVVRSRDGVTTIQRALDAFTDADSVDPQAVTRAGAAALLARRIIVAEGRTEVGFLRAMASIWSKSRQVPMAHLGTTTTDGGGHQAAGRAIGFAQLGYETALFVDSDRVLNPSIEAAAEAGVRVIQWAGSVSIEERIAHDLPEENLGELVELAIDLVEDDEAVLSAIHAQMPAGTDRLVTREPQSWVGPATPIAAIRGAVGVAARMKGWFKGIDQGERLGQLVGEILPQMSGSDTAAKTAALESFAYGEGQ